jgi:hypothetical protein
MGGSSAQCSAAPHGPGRVKGSVGQSRAAGGSRNRRRGAARSRAPKATTADESRGEINPCHAPAAPKATRVSGRGRMKGQTARAPGQFGCKGKRGWGGGPPLLSGTRRAWSSVRKRAGRGQWARSVGRVGQCAGWGWRGLAVGGWWLVDGACRPLSGQGPWRCCCRMSPCTAIITRPFAACSWPKSLFGAQSP